MFAMIRTRNAQYDRVEILKDKTKSYEIKYPKLTMKGSVDIFETIPKSHIVRFRPYIN